jgi:hypothetical protein
VWKKRFKKSGSLNRIEVALTAFFRMAGGDKNWKR